MTGPGFDDALIWTAAVAVGYPLVAIALVELQRRLRTTQPELARIAGLVQVTVLPPFGIWLLANYVAHAPADGVGMKLILSVLAITAINACLALFNVIMRSGLIEAQWIERTPALMLDLARLFLVLIAAAFVASDIWAVDLGSLLAALGVGSVVLGLALQDTLSGLFAGVSLMSGRHFKEGDWIEFGDISGKIVEMNWRTVTIETMDDERLIVIPNSALSSSPFTVLIAGNRAYGENVYVTFSYDSPPARVMDALDRAVRAVNLILTDPPHDIDLARHEEGGIVYEVTIHTATREDGEAAITDFLKKLWYIAAREGLVLSGAADRRFRQVGYVPPGPAAIRTLLLGADLFEPDAPGLDDLVESARPLLFDAEEVLQPLGAPFDRLFLISEGELRVEVEQAGQRRVVQGLGRGEFFLARALLTSAPSPVELRAAGEVTVLELPAEALLDFLGRNSGLARRFDIRIDMTEHGLVSAMERSNSDALEANTVPG